MRFLSALSRLLSTMEGISFAPRGARERLEGIVANLILNRIEAVRHQRDPVTEIVALGDIARRYWRVIRQALASAGIGGGG